LHHIFDEYLTLPGFLCFFPICRNVLVRLARSSNTRRRNLPWLASQIDHRRPERAVCDDHRCQTAPAAGPCLSHDSSLAGAVATLTAVARVHHRAGLAPDLARRELPQCPIEAHPCRDWEGLHIIIIILYIRWRCERRVVQQIELRFTHKLGRLRGCAPHTLPRPPVRARRHRRRPAQ
jgi:hypothetical protein